MQGWNARNPAVKRILQELRECQQDDNPDVLATAAEENLFEWHFAIRGAWDSDFAGGIYHGRILLPADYPFKPPSFVMATPSGRWEVGTKICLSISSHHPESWQPSWSVRAALVALRAFMQTPAGGAVGAVDASPEARRALAQDSRAWVPRSSSATTQEQLNGLHASMLAAEAGSRALHLAQVGSEQRAGPAAPSQDGAGPAAADDVAATASAQADAAAAQAAASESTRPGVVSPAAAAPEASEPEDDARGVGADRAEPEVRTTVDHQALPPSGAAAAAARSPSPDPRPEVVAPPPFPAFLRMADAPSLHHRTPPLGEDRGLTYLALLLVLCILAIMVRKVFLVMHVDTDEVYYSFHRTPVVEL
uniref:UBC core domain-containing protein n=1 Tax=Auxenochlorella protothecoides TaxID=3075 RepID=A0A1D1ZZH7_AUXPR